jgi:hypothetical protein
MLPERLAALLRQRALVAQHLAWLDAEIAEVAGTPLASPTPPALSAPVAPSAVASAVTDATAPELSEPISPAVAAANQRADAIIEKYRTTEAINPAQTKRGCLLSFIAFMLFSIAGVLAIYLLNYRSE